MVNAAIAMCFALGVSASSEPAVVLNNGVTMPTIAVSAGSPEESVKRIKLAWDAGVKHFITANDYLNQEQVGEGLHALGVDRSAYFLTTMTSPCQCKQDRPHCDRNVTEEAACYDLTKAELESDLAQLGHDHVDLVLLHAPNTAFGFRGGCDEAVCKANRVQWRAYMDFLAAGKARAIGVSNFCPSCLECLLGEGNVVPAVNQIQYHVASGPDPMGLVSFAAQQGIVVQAYQPLAQGAIASSSDCRDIGASHGKSAAQVAMRWILQNAHATAGVAVFTSSSNSTYLEEDLALFDWNLTAAEMQRLDALTCDDHPEFCPYADGLPGWGCGMLEESAIV